MSENNFIETVKKDYQAAFEAGTMGIQDYLQAFALDLIRSGATDIEVGTAIRNKLIQILKKEP